MVQAELSTNRLADLLTIEENFGLTSGLPVALTWAPHIKALPKAVPNSFLLTAAARGCAVRIAHPPGFELHPQIVREAEQFARRSGGSVAPPVTLTFTHPASAGRNRTVRTAFGASAPEEMTGYDTRARLLYW